MKNPGKILKENYWLHSVLNSYGLIFFSLDAVFATIILAVTFFVPAIGVCGLLAVVLVNIIAYRIGFNRDEIRNGVFGFNALFIGLALGYEFSFNFRNFETLQLVYCAAVKSNVW